VRVCCGTVQCRHDRPCLAAGAQCYELAYLGQDAGGKARARAPITRPALLVHASVQLSAQSTTAYLSMAKARASLQRQAEELDIHHEDIKGGDPEDTLDESADPLEESGRTIDTSEDEEVDEMVAEDIERFENSFVGINKRYRVINRIGEGQSLRWLASRRHAAWLNLTYMTMQAHSQQYTKLRTWSTTSTITAGMSTSASDASGHRPPAKPNARRENPTMWLSRRSM
jgi:hypothetical protein